MLFSKLMFLFDKLNSIRSQLSLSFLAVSLVPCICLLFVFLYQAQEYRYKEDLSQERATERLAETIAQHVEMHRRGIEAAAKQITLRGGAGTSSKEDLQAVLAALHEQFPSFINLYFADTKAKTLAFYPEFNTAGKSMVGVDFSHRWHYSKLLEEKKTHISPVMKGEGGTEKLLITIVSPYFSGPNGKFLGFVLGALDLSKIGNLVNSLNLEPEYFSVITDSENYIISSPGWNELSQPKRLVSLAEDSKIKNKTEHYSELKKANVFSTVKSVDPLNWQVRISRMSEDRSKNFNVVLVCGFLGISILLLFIWYLTKKLAFNFAIDLEQLSKLAQKIARGEFPTRKKEFLFRNEQTQEVRALASSLLSMSKDLKAAHEKMQEANNHLRTGVQHKTATLTAVLESMEEGFALFDGRGLPLFINKNLEQLLNIPKWEIRSCEQFLHFFKGENQNLTLSEIFKHYQSLIKKSEKVWLRLHLFPVNTSTEIIGYALTVKDVSKQTQLENLKNSLISIVAHEMKTPVAALRMEVDTLRRKDVEWPREFVEETVEDIADEVKRLEHLVTDWLDISKIESGSLKLSLKNINLQAVIEEAAAEVKRTSRCEFLIDAKDCEVLADRNRIRQVFINLFSNAVRYCDRMPSVGVRVKMGERVEVSVKDNGIGIASDNLGKIFEKFHQVDMTDLRRQGGTGLGLAICKGIIEAHGGVIRAESVLGQGSTFYIYLPRVVK